MAAADVESEAVAVPPDAAELPDGGVVVEVPLEQPLTASERHATKHSDTLSRRFIGEFSDIENIERRRGLGRNWTKSWPSDLKSVFAEES